MESIGVQPESSFTIELMHESSLMELAKRGLRLWTASYQEISHWSMIGINCQTSEKTSSD